MHNTIKYSCLLGPSHTWDKFEICPRKIQNEIGQWQSHNRTSTFSFLLPIFLKFSANASVLGDKVAVDSKILLSSGYESDLWLIKFSASLLNGDSATDHLSVHFRLKHPLFYFTRFESVCLLQRLLMGSLKTTFCPLPSKLVTLGFSMWWKIFGKSKQHCPLLQLSSTFTISSSSFLCHFYFMSTC